MKKPTLEDVKLANPVFFSPEFGAKGEYHEAFVDTEADQHVLKLHTKGDTFPVYKINPTDFSLEYLRHGWTPEGRLQ
jgi:hypothetical protein